MTSHKNTQNPRHSSGSSIEQEMIVAAIVWLAVAGVCVAAANVWLI